MDASKTFLDKYNVSLTIVGTAIVLSTLLGECSFDYATGDVEVSTNPADVVEAVKEEE